MTFAERLMCAGVRELFKVGQEKVMVEKIRSNDETAQFHVAETHRVYKLEIYQ